MITKIKINNFKCFHEIVLPMSTLTLLTGFNAAGKSTVLQSILLLSQALHKNVICSNVSINGNLIKLGNASDLIHEPISPIPDQTQEIKIGIQGENADISWMFSPMKKNRNNLISTSFSYQMNSESEPNVFLSPETLVPDNIDSDSLEFIKRIKDIIYISASRIGIQDLFPSPEDEQISYANVGCLGEFAPWWFENYSDEDINEELRYPEERNSLTLRRQLNAWLGYIFPGAEVNTIAIDGTGFVQLQFKNCATGEWRRPANIGFGLTYIFPILVAGLLAKPGQILIIDSPEAHLHPMGQSRIGAFLSKVSSSGIQVIVETHSDHILNGVRIAVNKKILKNNKLSIHFFKKDVEGNNNLLITSPKIDSEGTLSEWPDGFFDQSEKDLSTLMGW